MIEFFCKDCGVLISGYYVRIRCSVCERKYLEKMNNDVCSGCKKRSECDKTWKFLVAGCESKEE